MKLILCGLFLAGGLGGGVAQGQTNGPLQLQWQQSFGGIPNPDPNLARI